MGKGTLQQNAVFKEIKFLLSSGVTKKKKIVDAIVVHTGLPRPTIRKFVGRYIKKLTEKVTILSQITQFDSVVDKDNTPYWWVPQPIRDFWRGVKKEEFDRVKCVFCKRYIGFVRGLVDGDIACTICTNRFPTREKEDE